MKKFKRQSLPGDTCFVTAVTKGREPLLAERKNIILFQQTMKEVQAIKNVKIISYVILPDHIHLILSCEFYSVPEILHSLEWGFSNNWRLLHPAAELPNANPWQSRVWEHVIQSDAELQYHINYIINNPVKHGFVDDPEDWPYSSFAQNVCDYDAWQEMEPIA
ncbi:MAG: transposase [Patescibacteria group bacterium]|nr:transposase [Patescibacteria group bacterium]